MKKNKNRNDEIDIESLKQKAINLFINTNNSIEPSLEYSELTVKGSDKIVLVRDNEKIILAYYLLLNDGNLLKLNN